MSELLTKAMMGSKDQQEATCRTERIDQEMQDPEPWGPGSLVWAQHHFAKDIGPQAAQATMSPCVLDLFFSKSYLGLDSCGQGEGPQGVSSKLRIPTTQVLIPKEAEKELTLPYLSKRVCAGKRTARETSQRGLPFCLRAQERQREGRNTVYLVMPRPISKSTEYMSKPILTQELGKAGPGEAAWSYKRPKCSLTDE